MTLNSPSIKRLVCYSHNSLRLEPCFYLILLPRYYQLFMNKGCKGHWRGPSLQYDNKNTSLRMTVVEPSLVHHTCCIFMTPYAAICNSVTQWKCCSYTHPFNGPLSGTTRVSQYQKGKTNLDFSEARDSEWQWHRLDHMQVCTSLQTDNHANTSPLSFLQAGCPSCRPTNSVKALKAEKCCSYRIVNSKNTINTCYLLMS